MNKTELIGALAGKTGLTKASAGRCIEALFGDGWDGILPYALAQGDKVVLGGFGTFRTVVRGPRKGTNPATGQPMQLSASTGVTFTAGATLKARQAARA